VSAQEVILYPGKRLRLVVAMRRSGYLFRQIAKRFGVSVARARQLYLDGLERERKLARWERLQKDVGL